MADLHPSQATLERFFDGHLDATEARELVGHLLTDCPTCQEVTGRGWQQIRDGLKASHTSPEVAQANRDSAAASPYRAALDRATGRALDEVRRLQKHRYRAEDLLRELRNHPHKRRLTLVHNSHRFQSAALCELLIEKGYAQRFTDAREGVELTELAVAVGQRLQADAVDSPAHRDLLARAWAYHGNALRVASDLRRAEQAFHEAGRHLDAGSATAFDRALLHRFTALLFRARRDFAQARSRQDRAIRIYRRIGETRLAAQVMSDQALGILYEGKPEEAIPRFEESLQLLSEPEDSQQIASIRHNLSYCLAELERFDEALAQTAAARPVLLETGEHLNLLRLRWLEGKIFSASGRQWQAEEALVEVRDSFIGRAMGYDAALVCLDLATVYLDQGRTAEVRQMAEEMLPIFQSREVHREALAALILFRDAAIAETLSLSLVGQIGRYLHRARNNPELRFELV